MAKIHIRGGSPLRLRFEDNEGKDLEVKLVQRPSGYVYEVEDISTGKLLNTEPGRGGSVFRTTGPDKNTVIVDFKV